MGAAWSRLLVGQAFQPDAGEAEGCPSPTADLSRAYGPRLQHLAKGVDQGFQDEGHLNVSVEMLFRL